MKLIQMCRVKSMFQERNNRSIVIDPQAVRHPGLGTVIAVICVCWSSTNTFIYCFFGDLATENVMKIPHCLFTSNWHELSNDSQKFYFMLLANSQRSMFFHGLGIMNSSLESYCKVS